MNTELSSNQILIMAVTSALLQLTAIPPSVQYSWVLHALKIYHRGTGD